MTELEIIREAIASRADIEMIFDEDKVFIEDERPNSAYLVADVPFQNTMTGEIFPRTFSGADMYDIAAQAAAYESEYPQLEIFENWMVSHEMYFEGVI